MTTTNAGVWPISSLPELVCPLPNCLALERLFTHTTTDGTKSQPSILEINKQAKVAFFSYFTAICCLQQRTTGVVAWMCSAAFSRSISTRLPKIVMFARGVYCAWTGGGLLLTCGAHRGGASIVWSVPCLDASKAAWVCGPPDPCIMVFRPSTRASSGTS